MRSGGCGEQEDVAFCDVYERVEDGGFGAREACCAKGGDNRWPEKGTVEVVRL